MRKIDEIKAELIEAIKNTDEYKDYIKFQDAMDRSPDLKRQVNEYRRQVFEANISEGIDVLSATHEIRERFWDMRHQEMVSRYLNAEICLCAMIKDICQGVIEGIDFDLDFL